MTKKFSLAPRDGKRAEERENARAFSSTISLGFLIIEFHYESVVQLPKSGPLCADVEG